MYRKLDYLSFSHELMNWMKTWELLGKRSWRLSKLLGRELLLLLGTLFNGSKLKRTVSPGRYEDVIENNPSGYYSHYTHPPNLN